MKKPAIVFRCDAGNALEIGTGHVVRCLTLANKLVRHSYASIENIIFLTRNDEEYSLGGDLLRKEKFYFHEVSNFGLMANSQSELTHINNIGASLIIIDRLETSDYLINGIKEYGAYVVTFEDYGKGRSLADLAVSAIFDDVPNESNLLQGYDYLILSRSSYYPRPIRKNPINLTATFGGFDSNDLTAHFLSIIEEIPSNIKIDLILGEINPNTLVRYQNLIENMGQSLRVKIHVKPPYYHDIIANSDIGISAGGLSIFEFAAWGIPTIGLPQYEHQLRTIEKLQISGVSRLGALGLVLSKKKLLDEINNLYLHNDLRISMAKRSRKLIDGKGLQRVLDILNLKLPNVFVY